MKGKKIASIASIIIAVGIVAYVAIFASTEIEQRKALEDIQISFHDASLEDLGLSGATLNLALRMYNPNDVTATLDRFDYELWFNDNYLGSGATHQRVDIPPLTSRVATSVVTSPLATTILILATWVRSTPSNNESANL